MALSPTSCCVNPKVSSERMSASGSSGRDDAWGAAIRGRNHRSPGRGWGDLDHADLMAVMDTALERINASDELKEMLKVPMFRIADTVRNRESSSDRDQDPNIIAVG